MRHIFQKVGNIALDVAYILSPEYKIPARSQLLRDYTRLRTKAFFDRWVNFKKEHFLGFTVSFASYHLFFEIFRQTFVRQSYYFEPTTDSPTIIDCGGNAGISVLYFKYLFPKCKMTVFEPSASILPILRQNIGANHLSDVIIEPFAVSNTDGTLSLYDRGEGSYGSTIVESVFDSTPLKGRSKEDRRTLVETKKLSSYIRGKIDLLKLDIEGSEGTVMRELCETGSLKNIATIVMEYHHCRDVKNNILSEMLAMLESEGRDYQMYLDELVPGASRASLDGIERYILIRASAAKQ